MVINRLDPETNSILTRMWREACEKGNTLSFKIASGSMSPFLEVDDVVMVSHAEPCGIRLGDIVVFYDGDNVVVHRIIGRTRAEGQFCFRQMGDAGGPAGTVAPRDIIGRVLSINKNGRQISLGSTRQKVTSIILGWRLRLRDYLARMRPGLLGNILHYGLRPVWKLGRQILLWRF